ncbi:hypothetical protein N7457_005795 [Penicillium paradoxum]|uniref:uncharacterized protein n=1 Tax=Penicillium paradoxum TaxID=176176 RepID=UPI00254752B6|nr:uncharacterized protein N7457_005795 [Penicillium paradoxum]KAJ5780635.1 hypothetical protein N7457_005795 [Penicillium paradoxum]
MPFPATPSPFRLSRRNPSTRRNGPQFAPTPRFLLSQTATQSGNEEFDVIDDDGPSSTPQVAHNLPPRGITPSRQRDAVDDSGDVGVICHIRNDGRESNELPDDAINSSPPEEPETPSIIDAEFDALFAPVGDRNKRRRVEGTTPLNPKRPTQIDPILSSPPETLNLPTGHIDLLDHNRQSVEATDSNTQRTPAPSARQFAPAVSTPGEMRTTTPFRGRPRFMLSSAARPPSSQFAPNPKTHTPGISPPEKRKPAFVLPRSPPPKPGAEDIPAPFSPSSRTLHRRGRNRAGRPSFIPGGMAAEVRSWVLEMGAKRENFPQPPLTQPLEVQSADASTEKLRKYLVTARINHVSQSALSGCGSLAFLQAEALTGDHVQRTGPDDVLNIMIMGPSRSKSTPHLRKGDLVGIHKGLNWNLQLGTHFSEPQIPGQVPSHVLERGPSGDGEHTEAKDAWLIAMEWDLIETAE